MRQLEKCRKILEYPAECAEIFHAVRVRHWIFVNVDFVPVDTRARTRGVGEILLPWERSHAYTVVISSPPRVACPQRPCSQLILLCFRSLLSTSLSTPTGTHCRTKMREYCAISPRKRTRCRVPPTWTSSSASRRRSTGCIFGWARSRLHLP